MPENNGLPAQENLDLEISPSDSKRTIPKSLSVSTNGANTSSAATNSCNLCECNMTPDILSQSFNITLKFISPAASSGPFCRICHEGDDLEDLVSLCKCTGSVGLVHLTCIERWLSTRRNATGHDQCEICHYTFETIRYPKSLTEWYQSDQGPIPARHSILGDIACFSLITPLAAVSIFLCIQGAKRRVIGNNSLEAGCLMAVATFLVTVYLVWNILTVRYHLKSYYRWRSVNQNVRLMRYRRRSTTEQNDHRNDNRSTVQEPQNEDPRAQLVTSDEQISPQSSPYALQSNNLNAQMLNLCLAETHSSN